MSSIGGFLYVDRHCDLNRTQLNYPKGYNSTQALLTLPAFMPRKDQARLRFMVQGYMVNGLVLAYFPL